MLIKVFNFFKKFVFSLSKQRAEGLCQEGTILFKQATILEFSTNLLWSGAACCLLCEAQYRLLKFESRPQGRKTVLKRPNKGVFGGSLRARVSCQDRAVAKELDLKPNLNCKIHRHRFNILVLNLQALGRE